MKSIKALLISLFALFAFGANAGGEMKERHEQQPQEQKQKQEAFKQRQVEGTILKHKTVRIYESRQQQQEMTKKTKEQKQAEETDKGRKNMVVLLQTSKGNERLIVDLGSVESVPEIKDGKTKLQAEGRLVKIGQKELFVANKAKIGDKTITLHREHQQKKAE